MQSHFIPRYVDIVACSFTSATAVIVTVLTPWIEHSVVIAMKTDVQHSIAIGQVLDGEACLLTHLSSS